MAGSKNGRLIVAGLAALLVLGGALAAAAGGVVQTNRSGVRADAGITSDGSEFLARAHHHAKLHYLSYSAAAFTPDHIGVPADDYFNNWDPTRLADAGDRCFNTSVLLPDGAQVVAVRFFYQQTVKKEFFGELNRQQLGTNKYKILASVFPTDTPTKIKFDSKRVSKKLGRVNNLKYAYALGVCPPEDSGTPDGYFRGAQIAYAG